MATETDFQRLDSEVQRLEESLQHDAAYTRRTARYVTAIPIALSVVLLVFLFVNYVNITSEYTEENLSRSLRQEMKEFSPTAVRELRTLGDVVLPVYLQEFRTQLVGMGPLISERIRKELDKLSAEVLGTVHSQLTDAETRVLERIELAIAQSYPSLRDPNWREETSRSLRVLTEQAVAEAILNFDTRFGEHVASVRSELLKFDMSDTHETRLDLQKKFIHLWLELLDQEITEL